MIFKSLYLKFGKDMGKRDEERNRHGDCDCEVDGEDDFDWNGDACPDEEFCDGEVDHDWLLREGYFYHPWPFNDRSWPSLTDSDRSWL